MKKEKEQLREIITIGMFYLMLLTTVLFVTTNIEQVSIQDSTNNTPQSQSFDY